MTYTLRTLFGTEVIDAVIAMIVEERSKLGVGTPVTGFAYRATAEQAGQIRLGLRTVPTATWLTGSAATSAASFTATKVAESLTNLQGITLAAADCIDAQAQAVSSARRELDSIARQAANCRENAQWWIEVMRNPQESARTQLERAPGLGDRIAAVACALWKATELQESAMSELQASLVAIEAEVRLRPSSTFGLFGGVMSASTETLRKLVFTLAASSEELLVKLGSGPSLLDGVRLTHGTTGVNSEFNVRLAEFEAHYATLLTVMRSELDRDADNALTAASRYTARDATLAQSVAPS